MGKLNYVDERRGNDMNIYEKTIALVDFWYNTDFFNFKSEFNSFKEAFDSARKCIEDDLERTIEIIQTDIDEMEDEEFTETANKLIDILRG